MRRRWKNPAIIEMSPSWFRQLKSCQAEYPDKTWGPARPLGYSSIFKRIRAAWLVFTGRADALKWPGGQ